MKKLLKKLAAVALATLVGLLLVEGLARLFLAPPFYWGRIHFDPRFGFRMQSGLELANWDEFGKFIYRLNGDGFRSPELPDTPRPPHDGKARIVFVGDSFVNAWAVREERLMTTRTGALLAAQGRAADVYALCSDAFGTAQELLLLREYGPRLAPDAVVLALFPGNDLVNNCFAFAGHNDGDYLRPYVTVDDAGRLRTRYYHPTRAVLRRLSRAFAVVENRLIAAGLLEAFPPRPFLYWGERARQGLAPVEELDMMLKQGQPAAWTGAWRTTEQLLCAFRDKVRSLGARLLVLVIPSRYQVQRDAPGLEVDWAVRNATGKTLDDLLDWDRPERRLAAFFAREGIEARFLLEPFRAATGLDRPNVYVGDGHLSWRGHEIAAASVAAWFLGERDGHALDRRGGGRGQPAMRMPPSREVPLRLDFRTERHEWALTAGWASWHAGGPGPGWVTARHAVLMLPRRAGELVLRGRALPGQRLPLEIGFHPAGSPERKFVVEQAGPFEIRYEKHIPGGRPAWGYDPIHLNLNAQIVVQEIAHEKVWPSDRLLTAVHDELRRRGRRRAEVLVVPETGELSAVDLAAAAQGLSLPLTFRTLHDAGGPDPRLLNRVDFVVAASFPFGSPAAPIPAWVQTNRWLLGHLPPGPPPQLVEVYSAPLHPGVEILVFAREGRLASRDLRTLLDAIVAGDPRYRQAAWVGRLARELDRQDARAHERRLWSGRSRTEAARLKARFADDGLALELRGPAGFTFEIARSTDRVRYRFPFGVTALGGPRTVSKGVLDDGGQRVIELDRSALGAPGRVYLQAVLRRGDQAEVTNWVAVALPANGNR